MNSKNIIKIINKYGLKPATTRDFSLIGTSAIAKAYIKLLKREMGFNYKAIAGIGGKNRIQYFLNEKYVAIKTEKFIEKNDENLNELFKKAKEIFYNVKAKLEKAEKDIQDNSKNFLNIIIEIYPMYILSIGIYNCFYRYIGNQDKKGKLTPRIVEEIGKDRAMIAELYPKIENDIQICVNFIGKKNNFEGDLLRYMTLHELKQYLEENSLSIQKIKELAKRKINYFYLSTSREEKVFSDEMFILDVKNKFFKTNTDISKIFGHIAYPGIVKGIIYNSLDNKKIPKEEGFILVKHMTHPDDIMLIKRCSGIITDEGGILSHAAVVSRELKKPCIIGTKSATRILKSGTMIELNADKGFIRILKN